MNPSKTQSILAGINRILSCPKLLVTLASVIGGFFAIRHAGAGMSDDAKVKLWIGFIGAVALLLREVINAWTEQDVATINSAQTPLAASRPTDALPIAPVAQRPPINPNVISSAQRLPPRTILPRP